MVNAGQVSYDDTNERQKGWLIFRVVQGLRAVVAVAGYVLYDDMQEPQEVATALLALVRVSLRLGDATRDGEESPEELITRAATLPIALRCVVECSERVGGALVGERL